MLNSYQKLKILAVGAHGDDIELACGGTLAKAIECNHQVEMVLVTGSGSDDHNDVVIRNKDEAKREAIMAATILGVDNLHILGYQDTNVPYSAELISKLDKIILEFNPDIIFTHFVFDTHQDHIRTARYRVARSA